MDIGNLKSEFVLTAIKKDGYFEHFGINPTTAMLYSRKAEDIVEVKVKFSSNQEKPVKDGWSNGDYWGWFDYKESRFTLVYRAYFLLDMCFPSGVDVSERNGKGKAYRLEVI